MLRFLLSLALLASAQQAVRAAAPLMPLPIKADAAPGRLAVGAGFGVASSGCPDPRLEAALDRFAARVSRQTGISLKAPRPADASAATLRVECASAAPYPALGVDESYSLDISPEAARIKAGTVWGALHGLETFAQLIVPGAEGFEVAATRIEDRPRFPWRGLMLDVARHWMPVEVVERNLDAMAAVKLNVFHWHLSDDQGFRVESRLHPRLQQLGSDGHYYTQEQVRTVVAYALDRGIRVVPEFDIPGHTSSWFPGYPELTAEPGPYSIERHFGVFDPVLDPSREETFTFLDSFLGEMAALFPDPYFHIGGDEVNGKQWERSAAVQAFAKEHGFADKDAIQAYFNQRILNLLERHGKTMIGWDEVLHPDLPKSTVIQSWRGQASLAEAATRGYSGILSWGYYLDHLRPASYHYAVDPLGAGAERLDSTETARILGGEACMWSELADAETLDSRVWPRAAAVAERLWSPREGAGAASLYERMEALSRTLEWTGIQHRANYGPMLDRLAGSRPSGPLAILADACEALGLSGRRAGAKYTTETALNRLVDAARPESELVRALERAAARAATANGPGTAADRARLRDQFRRWAGNDAEFQALADGNALLAEARPLSRDLARLGTVGIEILGYLESAKPVPPGWLARQAKDLARMSKPAAEVNLAAVRPVKLLLDQLASRNR